MNKIEKAKLFAKKAHDSIDQKRKYTGEPYIVHPIKVMEIVRTVQHTEEMLCAALLHDVLEDTPVTESELHKEFGSKISDLVLWLTDVSKPENGNRALRKAIDRQHSAMAPAEAQTIKIADLIDNTNSILQHDKNFAKVYILEKELLLGLLNKGDKNLWKIAKKQVEEAKFILSRD